MKTFLITIRPSSGFGTPLKADTLFGHLCWQFQYDSELLGRPLSDLLDSYETSPFLVVSSAFPQLDEANNPSFVFPRPAAPAPQDSSEQTPRDLTQRKAAKHRKWVIVSSSQPLKTSAASQCHDEEHVRQRVLDGLPPAERETLIRRSSKKIQVPRPRLHCRVNRVTGSTGDGALYKSDEVYYLPGMRLAIFAGLRDDLPVTGLKTAFERLGLQGYGRDASSGLGRFTVENCQPYELGRLGESCDSAWYALGPCVPEKQAWSRMFFQPFVRFGRHGDVLARSGNPFKNPVIMADEGAVLVGKKSRPEPYVGMALKNLSFESATVGQGYALCLPIKIGEVT